MHCRNVGSANQIAELLISYGIKSSARRQKMYVLRCMYTVLTWLTDPWLTPKLVGKAISYATKAFGYSELRPNQELAVKHFFRGHDVFVSLPIGSGKSLCYCLLPKESLGAFLALLDLPGDLAVEVRRAFDLYRATAPVLFTSYHEPELQGSFIRTGRYRYPL